MRAVARIFVWGDSTLAEVGAQLARVLPVCRARERRVVYALRRAGTARDKVTLCGYTRTDGTSMDDAKTLAQCGFSPGDTLFVVVQPWSFQREKRERTLADSAPSQEAAQAPDTKRSRR